MYNSRLFSIFAKQTTVKTFVTSTSGVTLFRNFVGDKQLNSSLSAFRVGPDINFFRNSQATFINDLSTISIAQVNEPRFNYSPSGEYLGLLIEDQATNLVPYSQDFTQGWSVQSGVTLTPNVSGIICPDGTETSTFLQPTSSFDFHIISWNGTPAPFEGDPDPIIDTYSRSIFVKKETARYLVISCSPTVTALAGGGNPDFEQVTNIFDFDLPGFTESSIPVPTFELYGNNWYRINLTRASTTTNTNRLTLGISNGPTFNDIKFAGSIENLSGVYVWGAQVEKGNFPSSYIPTSGTEIIRASDNAYIEKTPFTTFYNPTSGTYFTVVNHNGVYDSRAIATFINDNKTKYMVLETAVSGDSHSFTNTSSVTSMPGGPIAIKQFYNIAIGLQQDDFVLFKDNTLISTLTSGSLPQAPFKLTRYELGQYDGTKYLNGHIQKLGYYPYRLVNEELSAI